MVRVKGGLLATTQRVSEFWANDLNFPTVGGCRKPAYQSKKMDEDGGEVTRKGGLASLKVGGGKRPRKEEEEEDEGSAKGKSEFIFVLFTQQRRETGYPWAPRRGEA